MIPLQLTLKNFLSYRDTTLDFRGLHTACICGANGAGKSSLLEAIAWAIWGQCRAANDDEAIHAGANNVRVDFEFMCNNQTYRIIRSRNRGRTSSVEFQIQTNSGKFRSITAKGVRATQQKIIAELKLDYDTFINSAYLRQGRADEFMLRRPNERKKILADLLKLDRYQELADRAKDRSKEYKGQVEILESSLQTAKHKIKQKKEIEADKKLLKTELKELQQLQERDKKKLEALLSLEHQRQTWQQQLTFQRDRYQNLSRDCDRLTRDRSKLAGQIKNLEGLLGQETEINAGYQNLLSLQKEEEELIAKFKQDRDKKEQRQRLQQQLERDINKLNLQVSKTQTRLESLEQQESKIDRVIEDNKEVGSGLEKLQQARQRLEELNRLQHEVSPLIQRKNNLITEIETAKARLDVKLEQLSSERVELSAQIGKIPQTKQVLLTVEMEMGELDKKRVYQKRVEEKGKERKEFRVKLQENQRQCELQIEKLRQKLELLQTPDAICPLCERELDETYRQRVIAKTESEHQEIQAQFWTIREQLAVGEKELQGLRTEYKKLTEELANYDNLQQELVRIETQLDATCELFEKLQKIEVDIEQLERSLTVQNYAEELQLELKELDRQLQTLNYDEQTHALVRGEEKRWRWAEIKQAKIESAKKEKLEIQSQKPKLQEIILNLTREIDRLKQNSPQQQELVKLEAEIAALGYDRSQHDRTSFTLRQAQNWQLKYQELQQAKQQYPQHKDELQQLETIFITRDRDRQEIQKQIDISSEQMKQFADNRNEIDLLEKAIHSRRKQLDEAIAKGGQIEQQIKQLDNLATEHQENLEKLQELHKQQRIYQELAIAFGKNGIQALTIENILPQLEAETNHILARLTGNQFHVQFLTQKTGRSTSKKKQSTAKSIDTLEILIADARGTRPYENYSGGEAFRINFSIRLALAKLLAQRSGTALQMLIIDEGFGTQDSEGCERLIAAINAIASDFSCILTVTHMQQFKEAFQTRIEVYKTNEGSQIKLSN